MTSDEQAIRDLVGQWLSASRAGDITTVLSLMTDDVVFLAPGRPPMRKADFAAASAARPGQAAAVVDGTSEIEEIEVLGDWAFMWARLAVTVRPADGSSSRSRAGHTLTILRKTGGRWLLARDANLLVPTAEPLPANDDAAPPAPLDVRDCLRHSLATLAYRGGKVLRGAPERFGSFQAGGSSRSPAQILAHVCDLLDWSISFVRGNGAWRNSAPAAWADDVGRFHEALATLDAEISERDPAGYPWARVFQGPLADALTHVGQLALLRRLAGIPVRGENYFLADIAAGCVGADQPAPRREFD